MSEDDDEDLLKPTQSLFMEDHEDVLSRINALKPTTGAGKEVKIYGRRAMARPGLCMQAIHRLGPVRHALAQRLVSGVVEVHAPWADMLAQGAGASKEEKPAIKPREVSRRR